METRKSFGEKAGRLLIAALAAGWVPGLDAAPVPVLATTSLAGDIVRTVAGDAADVSVWLPPDADPHTFQPKPADLAKLEKARLVFVNGLGLERFLDPLLRQPGVSAKIVNLSEGFAARRLEDANGGHDHAHGEFDPHVWTDTRAVRQWARNAARALAGVAPERKADFERNVDALAVRLDELDRWVEEELKKVPADRRLLLTDHEELDYFAARYGFRIVGTILPGFSTMAQPSARDLAALQDQISQLKIPALFVGNAVSPRIAEQLARDTGVKIVRLYTHGTGPAGGPAATYIESVRFNVRTIVEALR